MFMNITLYDLLVSTYIFYRNFNNFSALYQKTILTKLINKTVTSFSLINHKYVPNSMSKPQLPLTINCLFTY